MSNSNTGGGTGGNTGSKGNDNHPFSITVVVGGDDQKLEVKPDELASDVLAKALAQSQNVGQPIDSWELKTEAGAALVLTATLTQLGITKDAILFASLKVGAAG